MLAMVTATLYRQSVVKPFIALPMFALLAASLHAQQSCAALIGLKLADGKVLSAEEVAGGAQPLAIPGLVNLTLNLPAYCKVRAELTPTSDSHIQAEVWMPLKDWNGRYEQVGNGGLGGSVPVQSMLAPLSHNFAVAATDDGHTGPGTDGSWAAGHPEKVIDFAYRAVHVTSTAAKQVLAAFYGHPQTYAYFNGCSEGGREAMMEAERYPEDFNGILAGAAAHAWLPLMADFAWNAQALLKNPASYIPEAKRGAIEKAALAACGTQGGVTDSFIKDPEACKFDPSVLLCKSGDANDCLTAPQLTALKKIYAGASDPVSKKQLAPGYEAGPEAEPGLPGISYSSYVYGPAPNMGLDLIFSSAFYGNFLFNDPKYSSLAFDFRSDEAKAEEKLSMMNALNPNLRPFNQHGGKLLEYHGWYDGSPAPRTSVEFYRSAVKASGGASATAKFYRLFMVPGMMHCTEGPGPNHFGNMLDESHAGDANHDIFAALEDWVEKGHAPESVIATKFTNDDPAQGVVMSRPLCPWPKQAAWDGKGDTKQASSFVCK